MSDVLSARDLAVAAAQGVAIALNARKGKGKDREVTEAFLINPHIICGRPPDIYQIDYLTDSEGRLTVNSVIPASEAGG